MPTLTACPSCAKQLKVPDELLGRQVKCPSCGTEFTAAGVAPPVPPASAPGYDYTPMGASAPYDGMEAPLGRPRASARLKGPGIALLISSIIGLLLWGTQIYGGVSAVADPDKALENSMKQFETIFEMMGKKLTDEEKETMRKDQKEQMVFTGPATLGFALLGVLLSILAIFGSIRMMKGHGGGLAWTAAIINTLPCTNLCCCAGIPIGIWAMIALNKAGQA